MFIAFDNKLSRNVIKICLEELGTTLADLKADSRPVGKFLMPDERNILVAIILEFVIRSNGYILRLLGKKGYWVESLLQSHNRAILASADQYADKEYRDYSIKYLEVRARVQQYIDNRE